MPASLTWLNCKAPQALGEFFPLGLAKVWDECILMWQMSSVCHFDTSVENQQMSNIFRPAVTATSKSNSIKTNLEARARAVVKNYQSRVNQKFDNSWERRKNYRKNCILSWRSYCILTLYENNVRIWTPEQLLPLTRVSAIAVTSPRPALKPRKNVAADDLMLSQRRKCRIYKI